MSDDLTAELRKQSAGLVGWADALNIEAWTEGSSGAPGLMPRLDNAAVAMRDAADEIDRLRAEVELLNGTDGLGYQ